MATIGIDLGNTFSCVAAFITDKIKIIPNGMGKNMTPSIVAFEVGDEIIVGETAVNEGILEPRNTIFDIKRLIGKKFNDPKIQEYSKIWPFQITEQNEEVAVVVDGKNYSPKFVTSQILRNLKERAEVFLNAEVTKAVVAVPAYFTESQKSITRSACEDAGLEILQLITEPTAAAITYYCQLGKIEGERTGLIFDLGGGTLDISLVKYKDKHIKILKIGGDPNLGGEDFDNAMVQYCIEEFKKKHQIDLRRPQDSLTTAHPEKVAQNLRTLKMECQKQKCFLSSERRVVVAIEEIRGDLDLIVPITKEKFEELNETKFQRCLTLVIQMLQNCGLRKEEIDDIVLVGGSTRIPRVQQILTEYFGKRLTKNINPDEAVAFGAAMQAHFLVNADSRGATNFNAATEHLHLPMSEVIYKNSHRLEMDKRIEDLIEFSVKLQRENDTLREDFLREREKSSKLASTVSFLEAKMERLLNHLSKELYRKNIPAGLLSFQNTKSLALAVVLKNSTTTYFLHPRKYYVWEETREYFPMPPEIPPFSQHGFGFTIKPGFFESALLGLFSFQIDETRFVAMYGVWDDGNIVGLALLPPNYPVDGKLYEEMRLGSYWWQSPEKYRVLVEHHISYGKMEKLEARLQKGSIRVEATMIIAKKSVLNIEIKRIPE